MNKLPKHIVIGLLLGHVSARETLGKANLQGWEEYLQRNNPDSYDKKNIDKRAQECFWNKFSNPETKKITKKEYMEMEKYFGYDTWGYS